MKLKILMAIALIVTAAFGSSSCVYQDARTACTFVEVSYDIDANGVSGPVAPALDYHREGVGSTSSNGAKQDGKIEPKTDLTLPLMK